MQEQKIKSEKEALEEQLSEVEKERNGRFVELPFNIAMQYTRKGEVVENIDTNSLTFAELKRVIQGFENILKNTRYHFEDEGEVDKLVQVKSQIGDWWSREAFLTTLSFNQYQTIKEMFPQFAKKINQYDLQIIELQDKLKALPLSEDESEGERE